MTDEQKSFIETMISKHKESEANQIQWKGFRQDVFGGSFEKENACYNYMIQRDFTVVIDPERRITLLTEKGFAFKGFASEEEEQSNAIREERHKTWPQRNWVWVAIGSFVFGSIISPLASKYIERKIWPETNQLYKPTPNKFDTLKRS